MESNSRMVHWVVWSGLAVVILAISFAFVREQQGGEARSSTNPGLAKAGKLPVISQLTDFTLTNQLDQPVRLARFADKVWFADIVFTRCAGPCPTMTKRMAELQSHFADNPEVAFVTLTTDPEFDTPEVMKRFARRHDAQNKNWDFLTGTKSEIVRLAVDEMKLIAREKPVGEQATPEDLFIHSSYFVVIDQQGRLRGVLESLDEGWKKKAIDLATQLLNE
ncbi:MAG: hypothetical protein CMO63_00215 [Verrucomicrobiales bacterium]|nr:hypothetical protein [Verrucomicrobiales bacterium]